MSNQILIQIQQTAIQSRRSLDLSLQQIQAKERERRILQLTIDEITQMPQDVNMYKGVGKMYVVCLSGRVRSNHVQVHDGTKKHDGRGPEEPGEGVVR